MSGMLAKFFRWNNSKLILSHNLIIEKILKIFFYLSVIVYRRAMPKSVAQSEFVILDNFDSDLYLQIDLTRAMGAALYWTGFHEFREFVFLHRYLKRDMVFIDIGANLGEYSLFAAKRLSQGKVLSFEPLSTIRMALEHNIKLNNFKNIEVYPFGLSSQEETLAIYEIEDVHEGLATFFPGDNPGKSTMLVKLKKLDDVVSGLQLNRIDLIKIDIEGAELKALQGCLSVISLFRPVFLIEINELTYKKAGYTTFDVLIFFQKINYQPFQIKKRGLIEKCGKLPTFGNILFMPQ